MPAIPVETRRFCIHIYCSPLYDTRPESSRGTWQIAMATSVYIDTIKLTLSLKKATPDIMLRKMIV